MTDKPLKLPQVSMFVCAAVVFVYLTLLCLANPSKELIFAVAIELLSFAGFLFFECDEVVVILAGRKKEFSMNWVINTFLFTFGSGLFGLPALFFGLPPLQDCALIASLSALLILAFSLYLWLFIVLFPLLFFWGCVRPLLSKSWLEPMSSLTIILWPCLFIRK